MTMKCTKNKPIIVHKKVSCLFAPSKIWPISLLFKIWGRVINLPGSLFAGSEFFFKIRHGFNGGNVTTTNYDNDGL